MRTRFLGFILAILALTSCMSSAKLFLRGESPEGAYTERVPFQRSLSLIIVPVKINGKEYRFLFDTGAPMVVSPKLAEEFDMKIVSKKYVHDSSNQRKKQEYVKMPEFVLGNQSFKDFTAIVIDLEYSPVINCLNIDGIIGANMMRTAFWKIDYQKEILHFSNQNEFLPSDTAIVIPFRTKTSFTPIVDLMIDSTIVKNVTFDTGSGSGLSISKNQIPDFSSADSTIYMSYGYHSSGVFGSVPDTAFYAQRSVNIGKAVIPDMIYSITHKKGKRLLGTSFFEDYDVILNWQQNRAFLVPRNEPQMKMTSLGLSLMPNGDKLIVSSVMKELAADKAGLVFKDTVTSINGRDCSLISGNDYCEIRSMLESENSEITISIKNKGNFTFKRKQIFPND